MALGDALERSKDLSRAVAVYKELFDSGTQVHGLKEKITYLENILASNNSANVSTFNLNQTAVSHHPGDTSKNTTSITQVAKQATQVVADPKKIPSGTAIGTNAPPSALAKRDVSPTQIEED